LFYRDKKVVGVFIAFSCATSVQGRNFALVDPKLGYTSISPTRDNGCS
jgi:hypothetical protein